MPSILGRYALKENVFRKRASKCQGSCKIGFMCTSEIIITTRTDGRYDVIYYKTHYGHELEIQHIHIPKQERSKIAAKLASGITISK